MNQAPGKSNPSGGREYSALERRVLEMFVLAGDLAATADLPLGREDDLRGLLDDGLLRMVPPVHSSASAPRQGFALTAAGRAYVQEHLDPAPEARTFGGWSSP